ncbi:MAG: hypothetical protein SFV19_03335 [Rhodospirillaceae bacterium]|nr:hypothetical protein [Rhodospirillaceae bacterium]
MEPTPEPAELAKDRDVPPPLPRVDAAVDLRADLIWEDELPGSSAWWLTRAHLGDLQVFIAADALTKSLLCIGRAGAVRSAYSVLAVVAEADFIDRPNGLAAAKDAAARRVADPLSHVGRSVAVWRVGRVLRLVLNQAPLALTAFLLGGLLGLAVGLFAVSTALVGWPMLAAGLVIGAASGPLIKFLIEKRFSSVLGPWGRFAVATLSAAAGALVTAGGLFSLYWT